MPSEVDDNGDCVKTPWAQFCNLTADKCSVLQDSCGIPISYGHSPEYASIARETPIAKVTNDESTLSVNAGQFNKLQSALYDNKPE